MFPCICTLPAEHPRHRPPGRLARCRARVRGADLLLGRRLLQRHIREVGDLVVRGRRRLRPRGVEPVAVLEALQHGVVLKSHNTTIGLTPASSEAPMGLLRPDMGVLGASDGRTMGGDWPATGLLWASSRATVGFTWGNCGPLGEGAGEARSGEGGGGGMWCGSEWERGARARQQRRDDINDNM